MKFESDFHKPSISSECKPNNLFEIPTWEKCITSGGFLSAISLASN